MRHRLAGLWVLATLALVAPSASASFIENPTLLFPSAQWSFSTTTNMFTGGAGEGSLQALFDDQGNFKVGSVELRSGNQLLFRGQVTGISHTTVLGGGGDGALDDHYWLRAFFVPLVQHDLPFHVDFGVWEIFVCSQTGDCATDGPASEAGLFTTDYSDSSVPLNNYFRTFDVPAPLSLVLLVTGFGVIALINAPPLWWRPCGSRLVPGRTGKLGRPPAPRP